MEEILQFMSQWKRRRTHSSGPKRGKEQCDANWTTVWSHPHCKQQHEYTREGLCWTTSR